MKKFFFAKNHNSQINHVRSNNNAAKPIKLIDAKRSAGMPWLPCDMPLMAKLAKDDETGSHFHGCFGQFGRKNKYILSFRKCQFIRENHQNDWLIELSQRRHPSSGSQ